MTPPEYERGWIRDDAAVAAITEALPYGDLSQTDLGQVPVEDLPAQVYLWDLARKVTGGLLPPRNQGKVGSCVAFGTARAIEYTMCAEIVAGQPEQFQPLAAEVIYGEWEHPEHRLWTMATVWGLFLASVASVLGFTIYWTYWMVLYVTGEIK